MPLLMQASSNNLKKKETIPLKVPVYFNLENDPRYSFIAYVNAQTTCADFIKKHTENMPSGTHSYLHMQAFEAIPLPSKVQVALVADLNIALRVLIKKSK